MRRLAQVSVLVLAAPGPAQTLKHTIPAGSFDHFEEAEFDLDQDGFGDVLYGATVYSGFDGSVLLGPLCSWFGCDEDVAVLGDVSGDGVVDFVAADRNGFGIQARALSGVDGSVLASVNISNGIDIIADIAGVGDVDGDGVPDAVSASFGFENGAWGRLTLIDGATWTTTIIEPRGDHYDVSPLGDLTGDGLPEFAGGFFGAESVYTAAGGTVVELFSLNDFGNVVDVGDFDGDGIDDILGEEPYSGSDRIVVRSGADLSPLLEILDAGRVTSPGDVDCDGVHDLLVSNASSTSLLSGQDLVLLWSTPVASQPRRVGDLDADGVADFGLGLFGPPASAELWSMPVPPVAVHCTGKLTSAGCTPSIATSGVPSKSGDDDFVASATQALANKPGLFFWGTNGSIVVPFLGGTLCVMPPLRRGPAVLSQGPVDCSGTYTFFFSQPYALAQGLQGGETVDGQFWMRDPAHPDGTGVALSNAVEFSWCP